MRRALQQLRGFLRAFRVAESGNVAVFFGLALVPIMTGMGAAIDFSRASATKATVQSALDLALLVGAKDGTSSWSSIASTVFSGNVESKLGSVPTPTFTKDGTTVYRGSVTTTVPTAVLGLIGINYLDITASGSATAADADNSCILTLDKGQPSSHESLTLNGAPMVNLSGCSIRSNTSVKCNGNDGDVTKTYAGGVATGCGKPKSNSPIVPDTFADLAKNITTECGTSRPGVNWTPGSLPLGAGIKTINKTGYVEYHICGDLQLSGSGQLTAGTSDVVIVVENGSIIIDDKAAISTVRTALVLTGDNNYAAKVEFPNGNGKVATLSLSPPTNTDNPWRSVSLYLDPKLTKTVDNSWAPGASFNADGLVYLANSNLVTSGNTASANSKCTKFVTNTFTTNGKVELDFAQQNCAAIGLKQWDGITVHLMQ